MLTPETALRKDRTTSYAKLEHRHFATIAAIIASLPDNVYAHVSSEDADMIAVHFANELGHTNPRFDRARFLRACNV